MKIIRTLGIALNPENQVAEMLEIREISAPGKSKAVASYWTGRTFKNNKAGHKEMIRLGLTITRDSNGHPDAWLLDLAALEKLPPMEERVAQVIENLARRS